jgi:uncharacterized protein involved in exopolysaccharide biosynthesis
VGKRWFEPSVVPPPMRSDGVDEGGWMRGDFSLADVVSLLRRERWSVALCMAFVLAALLTWTLLKGREYTSVSSFTPLSSSVSPELAGAAVQFGINLPGSDDQTQSPAFYEALLGADHVLRETVNSEYVDPSSGRQASLVTIWQADGRSEEQRVASAIEDLGERIDVGSVQRTGIVTLRVRAESAELARGINARMLEVLHAFNLERRGSRAEKEREFVEGRVEAKLRDLRAAEDRLEAFLKANRSYERSPELRFQYERFVRDVSTHQAVYATLSQSLEQAKIDEVRDIPLFTLIDVPRAPVKPDARGLAFRGFLGLFGGAVLGIAVALLRDRRRRRFGVPATQP